MSQSRTLATMLQGHSLTKKWTKEKAKERVIEMLTYRTILIFEDNTKMI